MQQGYYSIIQYCPDWVRLEVCNVGIVLFCPGVRFLDAMVFPNIKRIRSIFGKNHDLSYIEMFLECFAERVRREIDSIDDLTGLEKFIDSRANYFRLSRPCSMAVNGEPQQVLADLFHEIFDRDSTQFKRRLPPIKSELRRIIKQHGEELERQIIFRMPRVHVPGFATTIQPSLGFMNGRFNLVQALRLSASNAFVGISRSLLAGNKLYFDESKIWGKQQLSLLVETEDADVLNEIRTNKKDFEANHVCVYPGIRAMADTMSREATEISSDLKSKIEKACHSAS